MGTQSTWATVVFNENNEYTRYRRRPRRPRRNKLYDQNEKRYYCSYKFCLAFLFFFILFFFLLFTIYTSTTRFIRIVSITQHDQQYNIYKRSRSFKIKGKIILFMFKYTLVYYSHTITTVLECTRGVDGVNA